MNFVIAERLPFIRNKNNILLLNDYIIHFNRTIVYSFNIKGNSTEVLFNSGKEFIQEIFIRNNYIYVISFDKLRIIELESKKILKIIKFESFILKTQQFEKNFYILTENELFSISMDFERTSITENNYLDFSVNEEFIFLYKLNCIEKIDKKNFKKFDNKNTIKMKIKECDRMEVVNNLVVFFSKSSLDVYRINNFNELVALYRLNMKGEYEINNKNGLFVYNRKGVFSISYSPKKIYNEIFSFFDGEIAILSDELILLKSFDSKEMEKENEKTIKKENKKEKFNFLENVQKNTIELFSPLLNLSYKEKKENKNKEEFKIEYSFQLNKILLNLQCIQKTIPDKLKILRENFYNLENKSKEVVNKRNALLKQTFEIYEKLKKEGQKYEIKQIFENKNELLEKLKEFEKNRIKIGNQHSVLKEIRKKID